MIVLDFDLVSVVEVIAVLETFKGVVDAEFLVFLVLIVKN